MDNVYSSVDWNNTDDIFNMFSDDPDDLEFEEETPDKDGDTPLDIENTSTSKIVDHIDIFGSMTDDDWGLDDNASTSKVDYSKEFETPWTEEELKASGVNKRTNSEDIVFLHKDTVTDYETETSVEYKIFSWVELNRFLDLSWVAKKDYTLIQSFDQLKVALKEMQAAEFISCDTETTGLNICDLSWNNPLKDKIVGCSFSWKVNQGIYIPFRHKKFKNMPLDVVLKLLKSILEKKKLIFYNGLFDYKVYYDLGINVNIAHDPMSLLFHINSMVAKGGKGLKYNTKKVFGIDTLELSEMTGKAKYASKFDTLDFKTCQSYGCADTDFGLGMFLYLMPFLPKRSYAGYLQDIDMIPVLAKMEYYGRKIDMEKLERFNEINNRDISILRNLAYQYVGTAINRKKGIDEVDSFLFNLNSGDDLSQVFYDILGMPVLSVSEKTGKPLINSLTFKTLLGETTEVVDPILEKLVSGDIFSGYKEYGQATNHDYGDDEYLLKWKKISILKHPFVYIIKELRKRIKLKTAFFAKLMNDNYEGKYFTSVSLTAAETHRIIDPCQTIPAFLKELFVPFNEHQYEIDTDYAQVEARVFSSLAGMTKLVNRLSLPWADFHRESGSAIFGKKPEDISKEERGNLKVVNFGLPFKMGPKGLVGFKYGLIADKEEEKKKIAEMKILVDKWNTANKPVADMLNDYRQQAITICTEPQVKAYFKDHKVGKIYNYAGMSRVFDLEGVVDDVGNIIDKSKAESVFRQAGNFPIQSYAAYLYRKGVINMMTQLKKDGLIDLKVKDPDRPLGYKFKNMVYLTATVHDESLLVCEDAVNPYYMVWLIKSQCMIMIEGHAPYYMGISFAHDWHEGHSGSVEMPVEFVWHTVEEQEALAHSMGKDRIPALLPKEERFQPREVFIQQMEDFQKEQIIAEFIRLNPDVELNPDVGGLVDVESMMNNFINYTLKGDIAGFKIPGYDEDKKEYIRSSIDNLLPTTCENRKEFINLLTPMIYLYQKKHKNANLSLRYGVANTTISKAC